MRKLKSKRKPSLFLCTDRGEKFLKRLCDEDDIKNGVDIKMPEIPRYMRPIKLYGTRLQVFLANIKREMNNVMP